MNTVNLNLKIEKSKYKEFIRLLNLFDFVKVEYKEEIINKYIKKAPSKIPLSDNDIQKEIDIIRKRK